MCGAPPIGRGQQPRAGRGREGQLAPCPGLASPGWGMPRCALPGTEQRPSPSLAPPRWPEPVTRPPSLFRACRQDPESQAAGALGDIQAGPSLDQALRERDEAIAKKQAVEAELDTCKARLKEVEAQLLEVLAEKLRLRQEEDMRQLVRQQVQSQLHRESRGAHKDPSTAGTTRSPWALFPSGWKGHWW
ncbi:BICD family-like cargo adapter 1 isoform X2 [Perognathus longimembris pacificus]|uniref:BICD family-like cargo adapter 1 isoform X2 n=1 Tax=Perognathus longimembris pacificus TaxID=214514 RepID=UPI002018C2FB|nr:BICD family-like cargo adapter 1 isoform X2 [Perognathus longimembris pacificus]